MRAEGTVLRVVPTLTALATSTVLVVVVGAVLPGVIALPVFVAGVVVVVVLLSGRAEVTAARVLAWTREPRGYEVASLSRCSRSYASTRSLATSTCESVTQVASMPHGSAGTRWSFRTGWCVLCVPAVSPTSMQRRSSRMRSVWEFGGSRPPSCSGLCRGWWCGRSAARAGRCYRACRWCRWPGGCGSSLPLRLRCRALPRGPTAFRIVNGGHRRNHLPCAVVRTPRAAVPATPRRPIRHRARVRCQPRRGPAAERS